jgi:hypothetical protein
MKTAATIVDRHRLIDAIQRTIAFVGKSKKYSHVFKIYTPTMGSSLLSVHEDESNDIVCAQHLPTMFFEYDKDPGDILKGFGPLKADIPANAPLVYGLAFSTSTLKFLLEILEDEMTEKDLGILAGKDANMFIVEMVSKKKYELLGSILEAWGLSEYVSFKYTSENLSAKGGCKHTFLLRDMNFGNYLKEELEGVFDVSCDERNISVVLTPGAYGFYLRHIIDNDDPAKSRKLHEDVQRVERFVGVKQGVFGVPHDHRMIINVNELCASLDFLSSNVVYFEFAGGYTQRLTLSNSTGFVVTSKDSKEEEG